jgi:hypothetical protein
MKCCVYDTMSIGNQMDSVLPQYVKIYQQKLDYLWISWLFWMKRASLNSNVDVDGITLSLVWPFTAGKFNFYFLDLNYKTFNIGN